MWAANPTAGLPVDAGFQLDQYADGSSSDVQSGGCTGGASTNCSLAENYNPLKMYRDGVDITGGTPQNPACIAVVGQMINLTCVDTSGEGGLVVWSMPQGNVVKDYQPTVGANGPAVKSCPGSIPLEPKDLLALTVNGHRSLPVLSFAWLSSSDGLVETADRWTPEGSHKVQATFKVVSPDVKFSGYMSNLQNAVIVGKLPGVGLALHFGIDETSKQGIQWALNNLKSVPDEGAGNVCLVQLVNPSNGGIKIPAAPNSPGVKVGEGSAKKGWLDTKSGSFMYGGIGNQFPVGSRAADVVNSLNDSPYVPLTNFSMLYTNESFTDYLMYQPTGGIWVTIQTLTWSWGGTANTIGGAMQLDPVVHPHWTKGAPPNNIVMGKSDTTLPKWSDLASNHADTSTWPGL